MTASVIPFPLARIRQSQTLDRHRPQPKPVQLALPALPTGPASDAFRDPIPEKVLSAKTTEKMMTNEELTQIFQQLDQLKEILPQIVTRDDLAMLKKQVDEVMARYEAFVITTGRLLVALHEQFDESELSVAVREHIAGLKDLLNSAAAGATAH